MDPFTTITDVEAFVAATITAAGATPANYDVHAIAQEITDHDGTGFVLGERYQDEFDLLERAPQRAATFAEDSALDGGFWAVVQTHARARALPIAADQWAAPANMAATPFAELPVLLATAADGVVVGLFVEDDGTGGYQVEYHLHSRDRARDRRLWEDGLSAVDRYVPRHTRHPLAFAGKKYPLATRQCPQVVLDAVRAFIDSDQRDEAEEDLGEDDAELLADYADPAAWEARITRLAGTP